MITTIQVIAGITCFVTSTIFVLSKKPNPSRNLTQRLVELAILSFTVGGGFGLGISAIFYSITSSPFPGESLDSLRTPVAIGAICSIIGPILLLVQRLRKH
jgi:hypothetical protein